MSFRTLQPVFLATPIALGGLGLDPPAIGTIMSFYGVLNGAFIVFFFSWMVDHFGVKRVYLTGVAAAVPCFSLFPIISHLAAKTVEDSDELGVGVWAAVGLQVIMAALIHSAYGTSHSKEVKPPVDLFPLLGYFRGIIHLHRRRRTQQSLFGGYEWICTSVGVHRACGGTCPSELDVLAVDR